MDDEQSDGRSQHDEIGDQRVGDVAAHPAAEPVVPLVQVRDMSAKVDELGLGAVESQLDDGMPSLRSFGEHSTLPVQLVQMRVGSGEAVIYSDEAGGHRLEPSIETSLQLAHVVPCRRLPRAVVTGQGSPPRCLDTTVPVFVGYCLQDDEIVGAARSGAALGSPVAPPELQRREGHHVGPDTPIGGLDL